MLKESPFRDGAVRLPTERALSLETGLSRPRIREYLSALQVLGLIQKTQGSGNVLQLPSSDAAGAVFDIMVRSGQVTAADVNQAREMYEIGMVSFVADRISPSHIEQLDGYVSDMFEASTRGDFEGSLEADYAFHRTLFSILGNPIINYTLDGLRLALKDSVAERRRSSLAAEIQRNGGTAPDVFETDRVHAVITDGLRNNDTAASVKAMTEHFALWRRLNS